MAEFPAMPLFCEPLLADTEHLTDVEFGRYMRLLVKLWLAPNRRFPNDDEWLARKFRCSVEAVQSELRPLLTEFFKRDGNWLFSKRMEREWGRVAATRQKQSDRAKSRWNKDNAECRGNAGAALQENGIAAVSADSMKNQGLTGSALEGDFGPDGDAEQRKVPPSSPLTSSPSSPPIPPYLPLLLNPPSSPSKETPTPGAREEEPLAKPAASPDGEPVFFREFYSLYPRKVGRPKAAHAFRKALARASAEEILDGLSRAIGDWKRRGSFPDFVPHPATWLNRDGWADEHYAPKTGSAGSNGGGRKAYIDHVRDNLSEDNDYDQGHETLFGVPRETSVLRPIRPQHDFRGHERTRPYLRAVAGGL